MKTKQKCYSIFTRIFDHITNVSVPFRSEFEEDSDRKEACLALLAFLLVIHDSEGVYVSTCLSFEFWSKKLPKC